MLFPIAGWQSAEAWAMRVSRVSRAAKELFVYTYCATTSSNRLLISGMTMNKEKPNTHKTEGGRCQPRRQRRHDPGEQWTSPDVKWPKAYMPLRPQLGPLSRESR